MTKTKPKKKTPPRPDARQIQAWIDAMKEKTARRYDWTAIRRCMLAFRNQLQVKQAQFDVKTLIVAKKSNTTVIRVLTAQNRIGLERPHADLNSLTVAESLAWNNTKAYPSPLPPVGAPWPTPTQGIWEKVTAGTRRDHQKALVSYFVRRNRQRGLDKQESQRRAAALIRPKGIVPIQAKVTPPSERPNLTEEDLRAMIKAAEEHDYQWEPGRAMMIAILHTMRCNQNRWPALVNHTLSSPDQREGQHYIGKGVDPKNKSNATLWYDDEAWEAMARWIAVHPGTKKNLQGAPIIVAMRQASRGILEAPNGQQLWMALHLLAEKAELSYTPSVLAFRYFGHNELAVKGAGRATFAARFDRSDKSPQPHAYVWFSPHRTSRYFHRIRNMKRETTCTRCGNGLEAAHCHDLAKASSAAELLGALGLALKRARGNHASAQGT